jgi:hypothetical protein
VLRELGLECVPSVERALTWSTPIDLCAESIEDAEKRAGYLFKLGLEVAGAKEGRARSLSSWQLLERATRGEAGAAELWREYARATKGRRMIELDDRATRFAKTPTPGALDEALRESTLERLTIHVDALELRAIRDYERRVDPAVLAIILADASRAVDPRKVVETWLDLVTSRVSGYYPRYVEGASEREEGCQEGRGEARPSGADPPGYRDTG